MFFSVHLFACIPRSEKDMRKLCLGIERLLYETSENLKRVKVHV